MKEKREEFTSQIKEAELSGDHEKVKTLMEQFNLLN